ncbi:MAG: sulfatase-like hydrolase/transferase [Alteromonadaceae bacterium]|nr:sulfatase-like hydrolase/transferase [Alteromonadaceae bacterium]
MSATRIGSFCRASLLNTLLFLVTTPIMAAQLPNIVVFISDDLGRLDTSIHGSKDVRTPSMDRLAAAGMTFDNAYVASPCCGPSRFSLLTGLMPARHGAHANHVSDQYRPYFIPQITR